MRHLLLCLTLLAWAASPAQANEACGGAGQPQCQTAPAAAAPCDGATPLKQAECAQHRFDAADQRLKEVYSKLMATLPPDKDDSFARASLARAERAWLEYKDANCDFYGDTQRAEKTWKSTYTLLCQADMTDWRADQLEQYLTQHAR